MRILTVHADYIEVEPVTKAIKDADELPVKEKKRYEEVLVVFTAVEEGDEDVAAIAELLALESEKVAEQVKTKHILLHPWVHLTSKPSAPRVAQKVIQKAEELLSKKGFKAARSPFGWYKAFEIKTKGHPLSELSRELKVGGGTVEMVEEAAPVVSKESVSDNPSYKKLIAFLDENKATYRLINHPPEGRTAIVSPMRGNKLSQAAHCIVIQVQIGKKEKKHVLAVVPGDARVDLEAVKQLFHGSYASFADRGAAEKLSESVSGTILPFSFNPELELIVDPRLLENTDELFFNAARLDRSLALKTKDYKRLAKPRLESIAIYSAKEAGEVVSKSLQSEAQLKSKFYILTSDGELHEPDKFNYAKYENLKKFADYEIKKIRAYAEEPPHIKLMKEHALVNYEPASDSGNFRWLPKGLLMKRLLERYVTEILVNYGAHQVETPIMYDFEHPALKSYLNRFPARQYTLKSDDRQFFLRFSACFGGFIAAHDMTISHKSLPFKIYELTHYSFRREQSGELAGLKRLRAFSMPDMHTFCRDLEQARDEFQKQFDLCKNWNDELAIDFEIAFRAQTDFFKENKEWYLSMVKKLNKPTLLELYDERYAYFITKFEMNFIDNANKASGLSTVQIDVENSERFDVTYIDEKGEKKNGPILHNSVPGAIERVVYALLEREAMHMKQGKKAMLPIWLTPSQVRLIPVSQDQLAYCEDLLNKITKHRVRVDFDDRNETLGKKIRDAEREWIPFTAVIGKNEVESGRLTVTLRASGEKKEMKLEELINIIEKENEGKPFERLSLSYYLTKRVIM